MKRHHVIISLRWRGKFEIQDTLGSEAESAPRAEGANVALGPRDYASCPREGAVQHGWEPPARGF